MGHDTRLDPAVLIEPIAEADGGGDLATVPALPGCMSDGETPEAALVDVRDAVRTWADAATAWDLPVPSPLPVTRAG